jgi:hypothetical protein
MKRPMLTPAACAFLGRRWQRRQVGGAHTLTRLDRHEPIAQGRSLLPLRGTRHDSVGAGLRPAGAVGGEERA